MTNADINPRELARRFILTEIAELEAKKEFLFARLSNVEDIGAPGFRAQIVALGGMMFELYQLRLMEKRYRGIPV